MEDRASPPDQWRYELTPLLALPELDLSVSVKSHYIRNRRLHQIIRVLAASPLTFVGYIISLAIGVAMFFVPVPLGQWFGVTGLVMGLPAALVAIGNLRFEMVAVLLRTYDVWFFAIASTLVSVVLGAILHDARASAMLLSWLLFATNICGDACILGVRLIWVANIFTVVGLSTMAGAVSIGITDGFVLFDLVNINGHKLPASAVVRDGLITMIIVIVRNIVRKYEHIVNEAKTSRSTTLFRCVSFRCRLQLQRQAVCPQSRLQVSSVASAGAVTTKTPLRFLPTISSIDIRDTCLSTQWLWQFPRTSWRLQWIGAASFSITNIVCIANVAWPHHDLQHVQLPVLILATSASSVYVGVTTAVMQRQLLYAVVTSFDFLFIVVQVTIVHIALADILSWNLVTVVALSSDLQWCLWSLVWDALTPPVRTQLGLSRHFAAWISASLMVVLALVAVIVFILKPLDAIRDRVIYRASVFSHTVEFRLLTWYFSCVMTIGSWALRVMWRLARASENELVVLDGTVVYEINHKQGHGRHRATHIKRGGSLRIAPHTEVAVLPSV